MMMANSQSGPQARDKFLFDALCITKYEYIIFSQFHLIQYLNLIMLCNMNEMSAISVFPTSSTNLSHIKRYYIGIYVFL